MAVARCGDLAAGQTLTDSGVAEGVLRRRLGSARIDGCTEDRRTSTEHSESS